MDQVEFQPHYGKIDGHKERQSYLSNMGFFFLKLLLRHHADDDTGEECAKHHIHVQETGDSRKEKTDEQDVPGHGGFNHEIVPEAVHESHQPRHDSKDQAKKGEGDHHGGKDVRRSYSRCADQPGRNCQGNPEDDIM